VVIIMVLPPCTDQGILTYQVRGIPFTYGSTDNSIKFYVKKFNADIKYTTTYT